MKPLDLSLVFEYVNSHIDEFHQAKIRSIEQLKLPTLLHRKNIYLFKAKNVVLAQDLVENLLNAHVSSSEEELFGQFLEQLAIYVAGQTCDGRKSLRAGVDLEFINRGVYYVVQIKSGPQWGNASQHQRLAQNLQAASHAIRLELDTDLQIQPILGICYGRAKTVLWRETALKVEGQNFWYFISENPNLYTDIIEPLGYRAQEHTEAFEQQRARVVNLFTQELLADFCPDGSINWVKILEWNSGNLDLATPSD